MKKKNISGRLNMNKQELYEQEKKKLQQMDLTPKEYEEKIKKLCKKLKI